MPGSDLVLVLRNQEQVDAPLSGGNRLLRHASDGADRAVEADRPGRGDIQPTGHLAGGDHLEDRQGQCQARRVPPDGPRLDADVDGQALDIVPTGLNHHAEERHRGILGTGAEYHLHGAGGRSVDRLDGERHDLAGRTPSDLLDQCLRGEDRLPVDGHDHVVGREQAGRWPFNGGHPHTRGPVRIDPEVAERHGLRDRLRDPHEFEVEIPVLVAASITEDGILAVQGDAVIEEGFEVLPAVDRGILADGREEHLAFRFETLADRHDDSVGQGIDAPGPVGEVGQPHEGQDTSRQQGHEERHPNTRPESALGATGHGRAGR